MPSPLERVSTITEKGQTTIPKVVRDALGVSYGGKIVFRVDENGVSLRPADEDDRDPVLQSFLSFLAEDMAGSTRGHLRAAVRSGKPYSRTDGRLRGRPG